MAIDGRFSADYSEGREGFDTPLIEFEGTLQKVELRDVKGQNARGEYTSHFLKFSFDDLDVIASATPWLMPICEIEIRAQPAGQFQKNSEWGVFSKSASEWLLPEELKNVLAWTGKGYRMRLLKGPEDLGEQFNAQPDSETGLKPRRVLPCWHIVGLRGRQRLGGSANGSQPALEQRLLQMLNGKTVSSFNSEALVLPEVRSDPTGWQRKLLDQTWLSEKLSTGAVTVDPEGVYHLASIS